MAWLAGNFNYGFRDSVVFFYVFGLMCAFKASRDLLKNKEEKLGGLGQLTHLQSLAKQKCMIGVPYPLLFPIVSTCFQEE